MEELTTEIRYSTAGDFLHALLPTSGLFEPWKNYIFRGHKDASYRLIPLALRPEGLKKIKEMSHVFTRAEGKIASASVWYAAHEYQLIRDFYKLADVYGMYVPSSARLRKKIHHDTDFQSFAFWKDEDEWLPEDMLEAAGLAQHYGVPTRLLDWTYDPLVAAFFASRSCESAEGDLCIWALCQTDISVFEAVTPTWPLVFSQPHYEGNPNLGAQKGLFTHWRSSLDSIVTLHIKEEDKSFQMVDMRSLEDQISTFCTENFGSCPKGIFKKLLLPRSETVELARLLRSLRYGPSRIFPGYGGIADEMEERIKLRRPQSENEGN